MKLGTRGSKLALWQAGWVAEQLKERFPTEPVEIVVISTEGDRSQSAETPLSQSAGRGVFVKDIEAALLEGTIDAAVHSAKDMPSTDTDGTVIAAYCERADPRDALISPKYRTLESLPEGATVATGSARRVAQLRSVRPDLNFIEIRGNVETRLRKVDDGVADALVLACAGLHRLGLGERITESLDPEICLPQVGQACVAVQTRKEDATNGNLLFEACDHDQTRREVVCERAFLARLGGGCTAPVAAYAITSDRFLYLFALVASLDGRTVVKTRASGHPSDPFSIARLACEDLEERGAHTLLSGSVAPCPELR
jgi:hydroxymethylbilane synthase